MGNLERLVTLQLLDKLEEDMLRMRTVFGLMPILTRVVALRFLVDS